MHSVTMQVRAQTSPDVDLLTTDAGFVSYDNGSTWVAIGEQGSQERICYNYPIGNDASILCTVVGCVLRYVDI
jgi:hypothetical protein